MIKMLTALTEEVDDADFAVSELLEQLGLEEGQLKNSIGLLHCYSDFIETGVVKAIGERLPFDVVGCTTISVSSSGAMSQMALSLTVLTSDDISFVAGVSQPVTTEVDGPVTELYNRIIAPLPQKPAMLIPFVPFMVNVGGDEFVDKISELSGNLPAFGTLSISDEPDYSKVYTIFNGDAYDTSLVLVGLVGDVNPTFLEASVADENILKQKAVVTSVNRNILQSVNGMSAVKYLESLGLAENGAVTGIVFMPFVISLDDGTRLIRACIGSTPDEGAILCGAVPKDSSLALATLSVEDIAKSTGAKVAQALEAANGRGILMYSCAARNWALGMKKMTEHEKVKECVGDTLPYLLAYSGGEIFPSPVSGGGIANHLQNDSIIICIL